MKKALLLFVLITAFIGARAQDDERKQLPPDMNMLRDFYTLYMAPYFDGTQPTDMDRKQSQLRRYYTTPRAQKRYLELMQKVTDMSDVFIKAPGVGKEAIQSLDFAKVPNQPGRYKITYDDAGEKATIELALINDKGEWKIDYIY